MVKKKQLQNLCTFDSISHFLEFRLNNGTLIDISARHASANINAIIALTISPPFYKQCKYISTIHASKSLQ